LKSGDSIAALERAKRPKNHQTTGSNDLFRARLDQIINLKQELAQLADRIDRDCDVHSVSTGPPALTRGPGGVSSMPSVSETLSKVKVIAGIARRRRFPTEQKTGCRSPTLIEPGLPLEKADERRRQAGRPG
jgi:hypothetical protein